MHPKAFISGLLLLAFSFNSSSKDFVVSYVDHPHIEQYVTLISEAYRGIDVPIKLVQMPVQRRFLALESGVIDADVSAQQSFALNSQNIVKVKPALTTISVNLLCNIGKTCNEEVIYDQRQTTYMDSGMLKVLEDNLNYKSHDNVRVMERIDANVSLFLLGRIPYLVLSGDMKQTLLDSMGSELQTVELTQTNVYHHIHVKHSDLIEKLSKALDKGLEQMKTKA